MSTTRATTRFGFFIPSVEMEEMRVVQRRSKTQKKSQEPNEGALKYSAGLHLLRIWSVNAIELYLQLLQPLVFVDSTISQVENGILALENSVFSSFASRLIIGLNAQASPSPF